MSSFFRFAQLKMLEHIDVSASASTSEAVHELCASEGWGPQFDDWIEWISPLANDDSTLTEEGRELLTALRDGALAHSDPLAELLVLRLANEHGTADEINDAVLAACRNTPIRDYQTLIYRLIDDRMLIGQPTDRKRRSYFSPTVTAITSAGIARLNEIGTQKGDPDLLFLAWQSDDRERTNRIRKVLSSACRTLGLTYTEATRDTPGSPEIHTTLREKIRMCGLFVADLCIVTGGDGNGRPSPNPNVMYELGLADSRLPPDRVMLLFDGDSDDLPFDIRQRRVSRHDDPRLAEFVRQMTRTPL